MDLTTQVNRLASEYGIVGVEPLAIAAFVLLDGENNVVFDGRDVPGTLRRCAVPITRKESFLLADMIGPPEVHDGASIELDLRPFPAGTVFVTSTVKHREAFAGTALTAATAQLKKGATEMGAPLNVFAAPSNAHSFFEGPPISGAMTVPVMLYVDVQLTGGMRGDLTSGIIDVWTTYFVREIVPLPPR